MTDLVRLIVEILRSVWGWVVWFFPLKVSVIDDGNKGARKTFGRFGKVTLSPGTYLSTSFQTIEQGSAVNCEATPDGRVECFTNEGTPVDVWAIAAYHVESYPENARVNDAESLATQCLEGALVEVFAKLDTKTAVGPTPKIIAAARRAMQKRAKKFALGIHVNGIEITGREIMEAATLRALNLATIEKLTNEVEIEGATAILAGATPTVTTSKR